MLQLAGESESYSKTAALVIVNHISHVEKKLRRERSKSLSSIEVIRYRKCHQPAKAYNWGKSNSAESLLSTLHLPPLFGPRSDKERTTAKWILEQKESDILDCVYEEDYELMFQK